MRILHFGTFNVKAGGPAMSTYNTLVGLNNIGINTELIMYSLPKDGKLIGHEVITHYAKKPLEKKMAYSYSLKREIRNLGVYDLYHAQGVWQYPTYAMVDVARSFGKPYLITPRGMLYPQDIVKSNKRFKNLSLKLRLLKDLNGAACIHVTCVDEMNYCRKLGITSPIAVIPNPIQIRDFKEVKQDEVFRVGYLGRLSPRKNVEGLIYAFDEMKNILKGKAELLIIGGGDKQYESFLKSEVARLKLTNVKFTGFLSGVDKDKALASLSILAMPSEFENLGNVILEGLLRKIPCIATKGSPWEELNIEKCGWWIDYNQESINKAIKLAFELTPHQLEDMGNNGRILIEKKYSIEAVANNMSELYRWILNLQDKPNFVYLSHE